MNRMFCFLRTVWRSIPQILSFSYPIEGHAYYETYKNDDVQILKCMECGKYDVGYYDPSGEPKPPETHPTHTEGGE